MAEPLVLRNGAQTAEAVAAAARNAVLIVQMTEQT